jgi:hypothetical protein
MFDYFSNNVRDETIFSSCERTTLISVKTCIFIVVTPLLFLRLKTFLKSFVFMHAILTLKQQFEAPDAIYLVVYEGDIHLKMFQINSSGIITQSLHNKFPDCKNRLV